MAQWHGISRRKPSGGRKVQARGKRATEISTEKQFALVGEPKRKIYRKTGGNTMVRVMAANQGQHQQPKDRKDHPWFHSQRGRERFRPQLRSSKHPRQGRRY